MPPVALVSRQEILFSQISRLSTAPVTEMTFTSVSVPVWSILLPLMRQLFAPVATVIGVVAPAEPAASVIRLSMRAQPAALMVMGATTAWRQAKFRLTPVISTQATSKRNVELVAVHGSVGLLLAPGRPTAISFVPATKLLAKSAELMLSA